MAARQTYSIDQIKDMLLAQLAGVVDHYAPPAPGSYTHHGLYFTLNPGRADRSVGSFYIRMTGPRAGNWVDHATGEFGDVLDLVALSCNCDLMGALAEARAWLGLQTASAEDIARRKRAAQAAAERRRKQAAEDRENAARRSRAAQRIFLSAQERLRDTPVARYLRDRRGIDLARLGRQPGAIRFHPACRYYDEDPETGEVIEAEFPAMVAAICDARGNFTGVHRTWLAIDRRDGVWNKAPVRQPKKVLGDYAGAGINIWRGRGPRGGKPASLPQCPPGTRVYLAEGIEDALSVALLLPDERAVAAISLSNLGALKLPENVSEVTLVADRDENEQARAQLLRAAELHQQAGRTVRLWQNPLGGKDLNDALRAVQGQRKEGAA
ncbi:Toprim domain-containing protein [Cribrihabitans marinus]|uniref:Toprim domain-containing protein n=1 Tax=Cribrihabitans marinus TaxID=1227549 RepID=A0A1H7CZI2_9RHOB|nr:toprim domain-containing protein [Cribrihabitans marinus]GGH36184.1 DNA primase [Cribrihabitans marinus]SEJ91275.1 Toprim domain-containing protein [Cribrihabitans marinus]